MTIVAITKEKTREDMAAIFPSPAIDWVLVTTIEEALENPGAELYVDLEFSVDPDRIVKLGQLLPALVLVDSVTMTLGDIGQPFARFNGWQGFAERNVHELSVVNEEMEERLKALYTRLGRSCRVVPDVPGMISGRILATIINEAYYTWEEEVSTREEIDIAMKLGTNYPMGPFEWGEKVGLKKIAHLLSKLSNENDCYVPAVSLLRAARN